MGVSAALTVRLVLIRRLVVMLSRLLGGRETPRVERFRNGDKWTVEGWGNGEMG
jgi:hypothetical protein